MDNVIHPEHYTSGGIECIDAIRASLGNKEFADYCKGNIKIAHTIIPAEEVYGQYTDTAGNFHWCGTHSGEHTVKAEETVQDARDDP